jgi:hypothetical protein
MNGNIRQYVDMPGVSVVRYASAKSLKTICVRL